MTAQRIRQHFARGEPVVFTVDGRPVEGFAGESVAAALLALGLARLRESPRDGAPRGAFCFMGVCQECAILIDGALRQACLVPVAAGLAVERRGSL